MNNLLSKNLRDFISIFEKNHIKKYFFIIFLMIFTSFFELLFLKSVYSLLNFFSNKNIDNDQLIKFLSLIDNVSLEILLISSVLAIFFLKTLLYVWHLKQQTFLIEKSTAATRMKLFKGYINLPKLFRLRSNVDEQVKNLNEECNNIANIITSISSIIFEMIVLIVISIYLFTINFMALFTILSSSLIFFFLIYFLNSKSISLMSKNKIFYLRTRLKLMYDGLMGANIFEVTGTTKKITGEFDQSNNKLANYNAVLNFKRGLNKPFFELFLLTLIIFLILFNFKNKNDLISIIPDIGVFLLAGYRLMPSLVRILSSLQLYNYLIIPFKKISSEFNTFKLIYTKKEDEIKNFQFNNNIIFKDVNFSYEKSKQYKKKSQLFSNLNIEIINGDKIGIEGKSGSGKSTFLDILMGLIPADNGKILVDNIELNKIKNSYQKQIGFVPQSVFLIDDSIKKNIAFGISDDEIDDKKIQNALKLANLDEFCQNLKFGINTKIGKNGSRVSGGQRQRIGIARAVYNNPKILIFDEATVSLDSLTENKVISDIFKNFNDKTIIFISHKKSNFDYCNKILNIENINS